MAERTEYEIIVRNQDALKKLDAFQKKILDLGKSGNKAGKDLGKGIEAGLSSLNGKIANQFTRDFNKVIRETAKGSGDSFAKGFGQSLRNSMQPQLTQLRKDIEASTRGIGGGISAPKAPSSGLPSGSGFDSFGGKLVALNQGLELVQKGFRLAQAAAQATFAVLDRGQEVVSLTTAFDNLQASVGRTDAINQLRTATKGLVSDLDLMRSSNQAVILGVDKGSDSFLELASNAAKLGRAMGIDVKQSLDSVVVGIGRQSKLVLDNLGVIVEVEKANQTYAASIGKVADQLTDAEQKTAFYNAAVEAIRVSAGLLPDILLNAGDAFTLVSNSAENAFNEFAKGVVSNQNLTTELGNLAKGIDGIDFTSFGNEVGEVIAQFVKLANTIIEYLTPAIQKLQGYLSQLREGSEIRQLASEYEKLGATAAQSTDLASKNYGKFQEEINKTKQYAQDFQSVLAEQKDIKGVQNVISQLKEYQKYIKESSSTISGVGSKATAKQLQIVGEVLGQAVAKTVQFTRASEDAGNAVKKKMSEAEKAAKKFSDQLEDSITKLSLFGRNDAEIEKIRVAAAGLGQQLYDGTISVDDLRKGFIDLANEGVKAGLSVSEVEGLVNEKLREQVQLKEQLQRQEQQRLKDFKDVFKDYEKTGTGKFQAAFDSIFGTTLVQDVIDSTDGDPKKLAEKMGFNSTLEQTIAQVIGDGINGGFENLGSGQLGSSVGGAAGSLLGSYFGPIGATIGNEIGSNLGKRVEQGFNDVGKSTDGTIKFLTTWVDLVFFGVGTAIQKGVDNLFNFGPSKEAQARKKLKLFLKALSDETKGVSFFDGVDLVGLKPKDLASLELPPGLIENYRQLGNALSFSPQLAEISKGLEGIGKDFGDILAINFENIGGLNDLQLLLQGAGVEAGNFGQALEDAYFKGNLAAGDFLVQNAAVQDLFAAGIPGAVGQAGQAFQNFVDNALKSGQQAQDGIRDIVAEAIEFGKANNINVDSVAALSNILINNFGRSVEEVSLLMNNLGSIGLDTIDEISNISVVDTASLVNNLQGVGFAFKDVTAGVDDTIKKIDEFRRSATQEVVTDWKIRVNLEGDKVPDAVASQTNVKSIAAPRLQ